MKIYCRSPSVYTSKALKLALKRNFGEYINASSAAEADLQWADYEELDFQSALECRNKWICAYSIRKALIRKHFLSQTVRQYVAKRPDCQLSRAVPESWNLEVDYAEFLDDALDEAFELRGEIEKNETLQESERRWFILKPGMSERGAGLRLFSTIEELTRIFEENESEDAEEEETSLVHEDGGLGSKPLGHEYMTSDMRFFVVQEYLAHPLLLKELQGRKFHLRAYVLCLGSLQVYVHRNILILSSSQPYESPSFEVEDLPVHLTNTCYQKSTQPKVSVDTTVHSFRSLSDADLRPEVIWQQLKLITGELFEAAVAQPVNFQTIPNAFEIFGIDYLVADNYQVHLLEVNAFPDFAQTGETLQHLVDEVTEDIVELVARSMKMGTGRRASSSGDMPASSTNGFELCLNTQTLRT